MDIILFLITLKRNCSSTVPLAFFPLVMLGFLQFCATQEDKKYETSIRMTRENNNYKIAMPPCYKTALYHFYCSQCHFEVVSKRLPLTPNSNIRVISMDPQNMKLKLLRFEGGQMWGAVKDNLSLTYTTNRLTFEVENEIVRGSCSQILIEVNFVPETTPTTRTDPSGKIKKINGYREDTRYLYVLYTSGPLILLTLVACIYYRMNASSYYSMNRSLVMLRQMYGQTDACEPPSYEIALTQIKPEAIPFSTLPKYEEIGKSFDDNGLSTNPPTYSQINQEVILNVANLENHPPYEIGISTENDQSLETIASTHHTSHLSLTNSYDEARVSTNSDSGIEERAEAVEISNSMHLPFCSEIVNPEYSFLSPRSGMEDQYTNESRL